MGDVCRTRGCVMEKMTVVMVRMKVIVPQISFQLANRRNSAVQWVSVFRLLGNVMGRRIAQKKMHWMSGTSYAKKKSAAILESIAARLKVLAFRKVGYVTIILIAKMDPTKLLA